MNTKIRCEGDRCRDEAGEGRAREREKDGKKGEKEGENRKTQGGKG